MNDDNSDKLKLFKVVIANLFFKNKLENKDYKLSFPLIYDFIKKMGTERSIISDLELLNKRKAEEELRNNFNNKYFSYKNYFKSLKIMEEREINKKENIDIINNNEDKIKKLAPLIRIFYYLIIFKRTETEFWNYNFEDKRKRHNKLTIIMDNFAEIGKHTMLELSLDFIGGYGINCIIFANRNELKNIYGEKNGFFSNMDILKLSKNKIEYIYKKMENFTLNKSTIFIKNDELANENDINDIDKID